MTTVIFCKNNGAGEEFVVPKPVKAGDKVQMPMPVKMKNQRINTDPMVGKMFGMTLQEMEQRAVDAGIEKFFDGTCDPIIDEDTDRKNEWRPIDY